MQHDCQMGDRIGQLRPKQTTHFPSDMKISPIKYMDKQDKYSLNCYSLIVTIFEHYTESHKKKIISLKLDENIAIISGCPSFITRTSSLRTNQSLL